MKRLLVPLLGDKRDVVALRAASALAGSVASHVDARLFRRNPVEIVPFMGEGVSAATIDTLIKQAEDEGRRQMATATKTFEAWCKTCKVAVGQNIDGGISTADIKEVVGPLPGALVQPALVADLGVFARPVEHDNVDRRALMELALFESGRPVLLAPPQEVKSIGRRIVIGWNGSTEAARAIAVAMPLLSRAEAVFVVAIGDADDVADPAEIAATLNMNGIAAAAVTVAPKGNVTDTLVSEAEKVSADLLVIGAYSHNRLREFVLGGVTRDLQEDAQIATLMVR